MIRALLLLALLAPPLRFNHLPLGSVTRVLSARYQVPITLLAGATAPVTGDFAGLDLKRALAEAARQAGLEVRPQGAGFVIGPHLEPAVAAAPTPAPLPATPEAIATQREALLRRRAALFEAMQAK